MVAKRNFVEDANAKHGEKIKDAKIIVTLKGEVIKTTTEKGLRGRKIQSIETNPEKIEV